MYTNPHHKEQVMKQQPVTPFASRLSLVSDFHARTAALAPGYSGDHKTVEDLAKFALGIIGYFQESCHNSWEGFNESFRTMSAIYQLFADIERALQYEDQHNDLHHDRTLEFIKKHPGGRGLDWQQLDLFEELYYRQQN
jgi:hypothetical protein